MAAVHPEYRIYISIAVSSPRYTLNNEQYTYHDYNIVYIYSIIGVLFRVIGID